ncbi:MAG TPA: hypothetical protein PKD06_04570, partial [Enterovirga sp.]|nr:hypothetical protein [Enterovirga sp.]
ASAQARFFLQENPSLTRQLQSAGSLDEANRLMANAWKFKGYDGSTAEFGARLGSSRSYLDQFGIGSRADLSNSTVDYSAALKSAQDSTEQASKALTDLGQSVGQIPGAASSAESGLASFASSLFNFRPGGSGINLGSLFGGGVGESAVPAGGDWFAVGGYTGPGGRYEPAGVVHRGEYVFSASAVDRIGLGTLDAMHRGLPGYYKGGLADSMAASALEPSGNGGKPMIFVKAAA